MGQPCDDSVDSDWAAVTKSVVYCAVVIAGRFVFHPTSIHDGGQAQSQEPSSVNGHFRILSDSLTSDLRCIDQYMHQLTPLPPRHRTVIGLLHARPPLTGPSAYAAFRCLLALGNLLIFLDPDLGKKSLLLALRC
eukprot:6962080-Pyramimonas_sp.AAC.1